MAALHCCCCDERKACKFYSPIITSNRRVKCYQMSRHAGRGQKVDVLSSLCMDVAVEWLMMGDGRAGRSCPRPGPLVEHAELITGPAWSRREPVRSRTFCAPDNHPSAATVPGCQARIVLTHGIRYCNISPPRGKKVCMWRLHPLLGMGPRRHTLLSRAQSSHFSKAQRPKTRLRLRPGRVCTNTRTQMHAELHAPNIYERY